MNVDSQLAGPITSHPQEVIMEVVCALVGHPDHVTVKMMADGSAGVVMLVEVHQEDVANLIGQKGRVLKALRTFMHAIAARDDRRIKIELKALQL